MKKPCGVCGELPNKLEVVWRSPPEAEQHLPEVVSRLTKLAGYDHYGEGEKLLRCDACGARFHWFASHDVLASASDYWKTIERVDGASVARIEREIAEHLKLFPYLR